MMFWPWSWRERRTQRKMFEALAAARDADRQEQEAARDRLRNLADQPRES